MSIIELEAEAYRLSEQHAGLQAQRQQLEAQLGNLERKIIVVQGKLAEAREAEKPKA